MQILLSVLNSCIRSAVAHFVPNVPRGFGPMTLHVHLLSAIISNDRYHQPLRMSNELSQHRQCTVKELGWIKMIKSQDWTKNTIIQ